jgi:hypothetical protein
MRTYAPRAESPFSEAEEQELAAELLGVTSDQELDQFLGRMLRRASTATGRKLRPSVVSALGGLFKRAVHRILPGAGGRFERLVASTRAGQTGQLSPGAVAMLGLEAEGLSAEDQEFTAAQQLIRLGGGAAAQAAASPATASSEQLARRAVVAAARTFAPGLVRPASHSTHSYSKRGQGCTNRRITGAWERRGHRIILHGI